MHFALPVLLSAIQFTSPIDIARHELSVAGVSDRVEISISRTREKEAYKIQTDNGKVKIIGSDPTGAMYGAFEFVERLKNEGAKAWNTNISGHPYLAERGLNLFTTLPWDYKKNDTDYDPAALIDPDRWWFQNDDYWTTLLDLMAHSRLNWLDIHGMWDISVTDAPNLYAYFVTSPSFPLVGVSAEVKTKNLQRLNWVIDLAHQRGIKVSLMAYQASLRIPQNPTPPYPNDEATIYKYTKEAVEQMIRLAPGLDAIGFRIGESGKSESFFRCYGEAVKASGREIPLITRSWITRKQNVLPLARASKDFTVEIKYNGEQWGAPYMVAGGRVANWYSYSFEDYLSDSGPGGKKMWAGNPAEGGGSWPSEPYKIVWQVRANGTHRIFPFYNPEWVRLTIQKMKIGTASGYTIEGEDAYYPKSPDYYLANPADKYCNWIHQRDEMYWMTWGRLGYDPTVPLQVFDKQAERLLGTTDPYVVQSWMLASVVIPARFNAYSLGPDHRSHAPELEWGGDTTAYIFGSGFDTHRFIPFAERLANDATGGVDGRVTMDVVSKGSPAVGMRPIDELLIRSNARLRELNVAFLQLARLDNYYSMRARHAKLMAKTEAANGEPSQPATNESFLLALQMLREAAASPYYKPFTERLRMHTNTFAWRDELQKLEAEWRRVSALPPSKIAVSPDSPPVPKRMPGKLSWRAVGSEIVCDFKVEGMNQAWLLVKPLPSTTYFHKVPMKRVDGGFEARFKRTRHGHAIATEASNSSGALRYPSGVNPYLVVPAKPGPTPQIYSAEEAMTYLDPKTIDSAKYGGMLLGTRAWNFFSYFDHAMQRKLLDPVERGMRLVILQQDFGRYKLDWLPKPLGIEGGNWGTFDPAGQLGLEKVDTSDIMWQRFKPSEGWDLYGNNGLARLKWGKGEIWVTSARLMQRMHIPGVARNFVKMLSLGGKQKPTILVDSCSEGADGASSCHPDLMNSHDIPFLTLGEVIAQEQGMKSFLPVPGPVWNDDVLNGRGSQLANAFLKNQIIKASHRAVPKDIPAFEVERKRRKAELLRALGLDPMPPKTPLNARETGRIQRDGYHIEKVVFESRPVGSPGTELEFAL